MEGHLVLNELPETERYVFVERKFDGYYFICKLTEYDGQNFDFDDDIDFYIDYGCIEIKKYFWDDIDEGKVLIHKDDRWCYVEDAFNRNKSFSVADVIPNVGYNDIVLVKRSKEICIEDPHYLFCFAGRVRPGELSEYDIEVLKSRGGVYLNEYCWEKYSRFSIHKDDEWIYAKDVFVK